MFLKFIEFALRSYLRLLCAKETKGKENMESKGKEWKMKLWDFIFRLTPTKVFVYMWKAGKNIFPSNFTFMGSKDKETF